MTKRTNPLIAKNSYLYLIQYRSYIRVICLIGFIISFHLSKATSPNQVDGAPPIANAGPDQTIYLTQGTMVTLDGSNSSGTSYLWTDISTDHRSGAQIVSQNSAITLVTGLIQGVWYYELAVTGGSITTRDTIVVRVDYDEAVAKSTVLRDLIPDMPLIAPRVNIRSDTTKFWSEHEQYPYFETRWYNEDNNLMYSFDRDRLNGQLIDNNGGKYYTTIEDGYPVDTYSYSRSEISPNFYIDSNKTYCFEWKGFFPQDFNFSKSDCEITAIMQINNNYGSGPPFEFKIKNDELYFYESPRGGNGADWNTFSRITGLMDFEPHILFDYILGREIPLKRL